MSPEILKIALALGVFQLILIGFKFFGSIERSWFWVFSPSWGFILLLLA
jgi:hypothetical protein